MQKSERIERARKAGQIGGRSKSERKLKACRENAKKAGRPANPEIVKIMQERGCTRQRAHQILKSRHG